MKTPTAIAAALIALIATQAGAQTSKYYVREKLQPSAAVAATAPAKLRTCGAFVPNKGFANYLTAANYVTASTDAEAQAAAKAWCENYPGTIRGCTYGPNGGNQWAMYVFANPGSTSYSDSRSAATCQ